MTADFVKTLRGVKDALAGAKRPTSAELITAISQLIDLLEQSLRRNEELEAQVKEKGNSHGGNVSIRRSGTRSPGAG